MAWIRIIIALLAVILAAGSTGSLSAQPAIPLDPEKALTQYRFDQWTIEQGLPMNRVQAIVQTADGYIWLGTQEGLVRFDGFDFHVYDSRNSPLASNDISSLAADTLGNLWIGTAYDGVSRYRRGHFTSYNVSNGLSSNQVQSLLVDREGRVWVGTQAGIDRIENGAVRSIRDPVLQGHTVRALEQAADGRILVGTLDAGLFAFDDGELTEVAFGERLPSREITALEQAPDGTLYVGTRQGVAFVSERDVDLIDSGDGLPAGTVRALRSDAGGALWIGIEGGGLARYYDGEVQTVPPSRISSVWALWEDVEGSMWIGTQRGGMIRLQDGKFTTYTTAEGLASNSVYAVVEDARGDIWVGTSGGGLSRIRDGDVTTYTPENGFPTLNVGGLYAPRDGGLWIGTLGAGLIRFDNGVFRQYTERHGLPDDRVFNIHEDAAGNLWMGTYKQGLVRYDGSEFVTFTTEDGLTHNAITAIEEGPDGTLWFGTFRGGLSIMKDGVVTDSITMEHGLPQNYVSSLHLDEKGSLWIATQEGGLTRLRDGRLATVTTDHGLFSNSILQILEDDEGSLWMSSNRGLFRARRGDIEAVMDGRSAGFKVVVYDRSDGLTTTEFNGGAQPAGWKDREGRLWFVSSNGVVRVDPEHMPVNTHPPNVVIERVLAAGDSVRTDTMVILEPGRNKIEIDFIGLSYQAADEVVYRYMLEGVDEEWVFSGTRRQAFYTNLPPGEYTFRVSARNADGYWSARPAIFTFRLKPFFYQTIWCYLLVAVALVLCGIVIYRLRVRHLKERQRELEQLVDERTRDLRDEKEKVEQAMSVIEEQAEQLRELDRVKTRFFSNISHEFRTPLTLNIGPLENALTGLYGPVPEVLRGQLQIMLRNARRLLRLINQLLDLSKLESGKMSLAKKRINIVQFIEGVVLSFTAFAEKNRIVLAFTSDGETLPVSFDPEAMEKVFFNLLSNAVKFTPEGGSIFVSVGRTGQGDQIEVEVRDTGVGISAPDLPFIFDRFRQAEGSSSEVQQGTGIGLALVKELVELHGGSIAVESRRDEGTTFRILLPVGSADDPAADPNEELGYAPSSGPLLELALFDGEESLETSLLSGDGALGNESDRATILCVDDNPDIRDYMIGCLAGRYRVLSAQNGEEGLEIARKERPDLIISDVVMPKMTGYELCRAIRAEPELMLTPIILVTSKAAVDDKIEGLEAGANDYLPKPFNAEELFARVSNLLTLKKQQTELKQLNETLKVRNVELKEVSELKSQLLRIAAHDLKNPLNNIREFANLISEEIDTDSEVGEMLELIQSSSNKMLELITQILESEALESGQLEIERRPVDLASVVLDVVDANRRQAERKKQRLILDPSVPEDFFVEGSQEWLHEAVDNLVSNAIKYSPPGMPIHVVLRRRRDLVEVEVRDQGPGLSEDDKKLLFQKFQRLSARPTGGESSNGLGLSIVKQIVEMHDGSIRVESEPGAGAAFIISLEVHSHSVAA